MTRIAGPFRPEQGDQLHGRVVGGKTPAWKVKALWEVASHCQIEFVPLFRIAGGVLEDWFGGNPPSPDAMAAAERWATDRNRSADRTFPEHLAPGGRRMERWIWEAIVDASLDHPIVVDADYTLMDGGHRLAKAKLLGEKTIKCVRLDPTPEPDFVIDSVSPEGCAEYFRNLPVRPK